MLPWIHSSSPKLFHSELTNRMCLYFLSVFHSFRRTPWNVKPLLLFVILQWCYRVDLAALSLSHTHMHNY